MRICMKYNFQKEIKTKSKFKILNKMKNIVLAALVIGAVSFSSCQSETQKVNDNVENTQENNSESVKVEENGENTSATNEIEIAKEMPTLSNAKANDWMKECHELANQMKAAAAENDEEKLAELTQKAVEMSIELQKISEELSAEEKKQIQDWYFEIQLQLSK